MTTIIWPALIGLVIVGGILYKTRNKKNPPTKIKLTPEYIDILRMEEVVSYFKSLSLDSNKHTPFIARDNKLINENVVMEGVKIQDGQPILLGVFDKANDSMSHLKLIVCKSLEKNLIDLLGNDNLVILS